MFFRKKKTERRYDFSNYKLLLNGKTIVFFEKLSKHSFYTISNEIDCAMLIYSSLVCNNDFNYSFDTFVTMLDIPEIAKWAIESYQKITNVLTQFAEAEKPKEENEEEQEPPMLSNIIYYLIAHGVNASWVMSDMQIFELNSLIKAFEDKTEGEYEENRLWTYLGILPHVDGKKLKSPEALIRFPWEKSEKEKAETDLKNKEKLLRAIFGKKKEENNG